jgi:hypothetical protein
MQGVAGALKRMPTGIQEVSKDFISLVNLEKGWGKVYEVMGMADAVVPRQEWA